MKKDNPEIEAYWEWLGPRFKQIAQNRSYEEYIESIANLPHADVAIFAAHCCDAEICNGGFLQLFYNRTGMLVPEAIDGFALIGKGELGAIVRKAAGLLGEPYPRDWEDRQEALLVASGKSLSEVEKIAKESEHPFLGFLKVVEELDIDGLNADYYSHALAKGWYFDEAAAKAVLALLPVSTEPESSQKSSMADSDSRPIASSHPASGSMTSPPSSSH